MLLIVEFSLNLWQSGPKSSDEEFSVVRVQEGNSSSSDKDCKNWSIRVMVEQIPSLGQAKKTRISLLLNFHGSAALCLHFIAKLCALS